VIEDCPKEFLGRSPEVLAIFATGPNSEGSGVGGNIRRGEENA
jgi:hypothetical protein